MSERSPSSPSGLARCAKDLRMRMKSSMFGLGRPAVPRVTTEEELQKEISEAFDVIIRLKKCGLNIILPGDDGECQKRFEAFVNFLATDSGFPADRPEWLTNEIVQRAATSVGTRIYSMQGHLMESPVVDRMRAMLDDLRPREVEIAAEFIPEQKSQPPGFLSRLFSR